MDMHRRTFLLGAASGVSMLVLTACTDPQPQPTSTPTLGPTGGPNALPRPSALVRTSWGDDPFSLGTSSYIRPGGSPADRQVLAQPLGDRVFFAGEATALENPNSVLGAQRSGRDAATLVNNVAADGERVIVVGAGIAGAAAASRLALLGYDVTVVEARDRVGGRIHSVESEEWPIPVERGAALVADFGADDVLVPQLTRLGIVTTPLQSAEWRRPDGTVVEAADGAVVAAAVQSAQEADRDASLDSAVALEVGDDPEQRALLDAYLQSAIALPLGRGAADLSAWYVLDELPPEERRFVLGRLATLVEDTLGDIDVALNTPVTHISHDEESVSLRFATGESISADRVVVTVPLGVLKAGNIEFDPRLPFEKRNAIDDLGVGVQDMVWLRFDDAFWQTEATSWVTVGGDADFPLWINLHPLTGQPILVGRVAGAAAQRSAKYTDDEIVTAALESIRPFTIEAE